MRTFVNGQDMGDTDRIPDVFDLYWCIWQVQSAKLGRIRISQLVRVIATDYYPYMDKLMIRVENFEGVHENGLPSMYLNYLDLQ